MPKITHENPVATYTCPLLFIQIVQYIMELHCRIRFLQTVGVRSIHRGPQGRVLQKLLIVAALTSPAMLLLLWRSLQFLTGSFLGVSNIRFY